MSWQKLAKVLENDVCPLLLKINVRPTHAKVHPRIENKILDTEINECFVWLNEVLLPAVKEYNAVRNLLPDDMWQYYEVQELTDLREVKLLVAAEAKVRQAWKQRPRLLTTRYSYAKPCRETPSDESQSDQAVRNENEEAEEL